MAALLPDTPIEIVLSGASVLLTGVGLWLMYSPPNSDLGLSEPQKSRTLGGVILGVVLCVSLVWLDRSYIGAKAVASLLSESASIREELSSAKRVYSLNFEIVGAPASVSGLKMLNGVDPFQLIPGARVIGKAANVPLGSYSITAPPIEDPEALPNGALHPDIDLLARLGVDVIVAPNQLEFESRIEEVTGSNLVIHFLPQIAEGHVADVDVRGLSGVSFERCFPSEPESDTTNLTIRQIWLPGWIVQADGQRVAVGPDSLGLVTATVPSGCHVINIAYQPMADIVGMVISGLTVVVVIFLAVWDVWNVQHNA
jgi:hypothetical protein